MVTVEELHGDAVSVLTDTSVLTAYVDETGNHDLEVEKAGASNLFICVAVLVDEQQQIIVDAAVRELSKKYFSGGEIKSSSIGGNHERRLRVLAPLADMDFGYYALLVDKARVERDSGLQYKRSFYKYLTRMLYRRLCTGVTRLNIVADEHGGKAFMDSCEPYLKRKGLPSLFTTFSHCFANSAKEPLIQLADLIAGSLAYVFDPDKRGAHSQKIYEILRPKQIGIGGWPLSPVTEPKNSHEDEQDWDEFIRASCINRVLEFEREHGDSDNEDRQMQIAVLRHLLFQKEYGENNRDDAIYADDLISHLEWQSFPKLNRQSFSSRVIGPLRDAGLVLAGSNDGYRLAMSTRDIRLYLDHDWAIIKPMLHRLKTAQEVIRMATSNRVDILTLPEYSSLRCLVRTFEDQQLADVGTIEKPAEGFE